MSRTVHLKVNVYVGRVDASQTKIKHIAVKHRLHNHFSLYKKGL
jgi:hypothetical protein